MKRVLAAFLLLVVLNGNILPGRAQANDTHQAKQTVNLFLKSWMYADFRTMHTLLSHAQQQLATPEQLRSAYVQHVPKNKYQVKGRAVYGIDYGIVGRPGNAQAVDAKQDGQRITVDTVSQFHFLTNVGMLVPEMARFYKSGSHVYKDAPSRYLSDMANNSIFALAIPGETVDTRKGESQLIRYADHAPAKALLTLRRYILVKEDGNWRITNALSPVH